MGTPFKMKGSPMQRNFPSAFRDEKVKSKILPTVEVSGGTGGKSRAQRNYEASLEQKASEEYTRERGLRSGGTDYSKLTEEQKIEFRAKAQKRGESAN